jgi:hypothetical protein
MIVRNILFALPGFALLTLVSIAVAGATVSKAERYIHKTNNTVISQVSVKKQGGWVFLHPTTINSNIHTMVAPAKGRRTSQSSRLWSSIWTGKQLLFKDERAIGCLSIPCVNDLDKMTGNNIKQGSALALGLLLLPTGYEESDGGNN